MNWKSYLVAGLACLCVATGTRAGAADTPQPITVTNYKDAETIRYPLVLLRGELADKDLKSITAVNESSKLDSREMEGAASNGRYKALAELVPGENHLVLKADKQQATFTLTYKPQTNPYMVRAIHFTDKSGDTTYESQFKDDSQNYKDKWDAALKLLQTYTADEMNRQGYGRKTFNLELDEGGKVIVHVVKAGGTFEEMQKISGGDAYGVSANAIREQLPDGLYKNLVCVAFSRHIKGTEKATAYAALGGGNVALMGGACFYTWPTGVKNILKTFSSDVQIDIENFHADDIRRFAVWATAATTIGSGLHELGHAFGLPHTKDHRNGIMLRGADTLNRYLEFVDPPCRERAEYRQFGDDPEPNWSDVCAAALAPSRWFALDKRDYTEKNTIRFAIDRKTSELVVGSDDGLAFLCVEIPGASDKFDKRAGLALLPKELRIPLSEIDKEYHTTGLTVRVLDGMGHYRHANLGMLLNPDSRPATRGARSRPASARATSASAPAP